MKKNLYVKQTLSTNALSWEMNRETALPEGFVVSANFQTGGKGQPGNSWESAEGKNLLFSVLLHPFHIPMNELFLLSQLVSVAIKRTLDEYIAGITVKWPNDIYWNEKKLAGILIENSLLGNQIRTVVIGIGLNVNQKEFVSDAPNPVSLLQLTGRRQNRKHLLQSICRNLMDLYNELDKNKIREDYAASLYRKNGFYPFQAENELFLAKIIEVHPDGQLELETDKGERKGFYFKEVRFVI
ncbi:MAG: biotin--[acetyl-CoA-carboxylase] ligase [Bacteroidota bacterium]|nr:biotin--[acetyl-CoA-carboxylase] ligase [Bacteroidota bacterium]